MQRSLLLYNLKLNCVIFFYRFKQLSDHTHTDIYCKLSKCTGQTPCSHEQYLVIFDNIICFCLQTSEMYETLNII